MPLLEMEREMRARAGAFVWQLYNGVRPLECHSKIARRFFSEGKRAGMERKVETYLFTVLEKFDVDAG